VHSLCIDAGVDNQRFRQSLIQKHLAWMRSMPFLKPAFDGRGLFLSSKRGGDFESDTTPCCKFARNHGMGWGDCTDKVVQNSIRDRFRKGPCVSE
jgi:hypothetical protein